jgi:hypothetical protein
MPRSVEEILQHADELARSFEEFDPDETDQPTAEALAAIHRAHLSSTQALTDLVNAVAAARELHVPWKMIGPLVGTSGEAARQRYGGGRSFPRVPTQRGPGDVGDSPRDSPVGGRVPSE